LQKAFQDLGAKQSDIVTTTLPRWHAEILHEVNGLERDVQQLKEDTTARDKEIYDSFHLRASSLEKDMKDLEHKFATLIAGQSQAIHDLAGKMDRNASQVDSRITDITAKLEELVSTHAADVKRLTELAEDYYNSSTESAHNKLKERADSIEALLKQMEFDWRHWRKIVEDRMADQASRHEKFGEASKEQSLSVAQTLTVELQECKSDLQKHLQKTAHELSETNRHVSSLQEASKTLTTNLKSVDERSAHTKHALIEELQKQSAALESFKDEVGTGRAFPSGMLEIERLWSTLKQLQEAAKDEHYRLDKIGQEISTMSSGLGDCLKDVSDVKSTSEVWTKKVEPIQQAVEKFTNDLQQMGGIQEKFEWTVADLANQVVAVVNQTKSTPDMQKRLLEMEWYLMQNLGGRPGASTKSCLSCGRRGQDRSASPGASTWNYWRTSSGSFDETMAPPQAPQSARPTSATSSRFLNEDFTVAGTAVAAARARQRGMPGPPPGVAQMA